MSYKLFFKITALKPLIEHARNATEHIPTFDQKYHYDDDGELVEIENPIVKPGLTLVRDEGIYLLSNGKPETEQSAIKSGLIVYAEGYDPKTNEYHHQDSQWIFDGDDGTIFLKLDHFERYLRLPGKEWVVMEFADEMICFV